MTRDPALRGIRVSESGSPGPNPTPCLQVARSAEPISQGKHPQQHGVPGQSGRSELRTPALPLMSWETQQAHLSKSQLPHL